MSHIRITKENHERLLRIKGAFQLNSTEDVSMNDVVARLLDEVEPKYAKILKTSKVATMEE